VSKQPPHKNTKGADHHYFPRALQKYWRNDQGWVSRLSSDGSVKRSKTGSFGHIRNAHHIKIADGPSPWDETFEHTFGKADSLWPAVVELLGQLESPEVTDTNDWYARLAPQWDLEQHRLAISECVASIVVRSPGLRQSIRVMVSDFWGGEAPHWPEGKVPNHLVAANQKHLLQRYAKAMSERGKFVILLSNCRELVFGDGGAPQLHGGRPCLSV